MCFLQKRKRGEGLILMNLPSSGVIEKEVFFGKKGNVV